MDIGDKVRTLNEREAFITVKDHKKEVRSCLSFHLINTIKTISSVLSAALLFKMYVICLG